MIYLKKQVCLPPRLKTGKRDEKLFKAIITEKENYDVHEDDRLKSHKNLTNTLEFFKNKLLNIKEDEEILGIINFTEKVIKTKFVVMTAEQESDKLLLFKTINARGLDLTLGDLIKNELCHNLSDPKLDMDEAIDNWDKMRKRIETNRGKLDTFLFHYINSIDYIQEERKQLDKSRGVKKWDKNNYPPVPEKYMFDIFSRVIQREKPEIFLTNILKSSKNYTYLINPSNDQVSLSSLKAMGVNKCFPLFLNVRIKVSEKNFKSIVRLIDSLTFRHSILRNDPKELERFYYSLTELVKSDDQINQALERIKKHANFKDENKFMNEFIVASPKSSISKMILDRITRKLSESIDWTNKDTHIEHIMPQKPKDEWLEMFNKDNEQYKDYLNKIGNLTILQDKKNIKARNENFSVKKKYYKTSRLKITNELCQFKKWDYESIDTRQKKLYELAKDIWSSEI